jgi:3-isopropylmalate/(R)-2-methylmalate dehydratase small subunit
VLSDEIVTKIWDLIEADPTTQIVVDLERLVVEVPSAGLSAAFPMDPATQHRFLNGLDDVGITLTHAAAIDTYEAARPAWLR